MLILVIIIVLITCTSLVLLYSLDYINAQLQHYNVKCDQSYFIIVLFYFHIICLLH